MKKLILVHDWIGPKGPLANVAPTLYHFIYRTHSAILDDHLPLGIASLYESFKEITKNIVLLPSSELNTLRNDQKFVYELQLVPGKVLQSLSDTIGFLDENPNEEVIRRVRARQGYFLLTTVFESFYEDEYLTQIHRYFEQKKIPLSQIIYFTNCVNGKDLYEDYCHRHNMRPLINCEYAGLYLYQQLSQLDNGDFSNIKINTKKEKLFLNFNRRFRSHRILLLLHLYKLQLLERTLISFDQPMRASWDDHIHSMRSFCETFEINLNDNDFYKILNSLPYVLDNNNFNIFPMENRIFDTNNLYNKSYMSLISETNYENNIIHITEKTIKPMFFKQPFVIIGPAHTLKKLRDMGFQTFNDYFDESYDEEKDWIERTKKLFQLIEHISNWPQDYLEKFILDTESIVEHNFDNLKRLRGPQLIENFIKKFGAEI